MSIPKNALVCSLEELLGEGIHQLKPTKKKNASHLDAQKAPESLMSNWFSPNIILRSIHADQVYSLKIRKVICDTPQISISLYE